MTEKLPLTSLLDLLAEQQAFLSHQAKRVEHVLPGTLERARARVAIVADAYDRLQLARAVQLELVDRWAYDNIATCADGDLCVALSPWQIEVLRALTMVAKGFVPPEIPYAQP